MDACAQMTIAVVAYPIFSLVFKPTLDVTEFFVSSIIKGIRNALVLLLLDSFSPFENSCVAAVLLAIHSLYESFEDAHI